MIYIGPPEQESPAMTETEVLLQEAAEQTPPPDLSAFPAADPGANEGTSG